MPRCSGWTSCAIGTSDARRGDCSASGPLLTTRYLGCTAGQHIRKRIEEAFGWIKISERPAQSRLCRSGRQLGASPQGNRGIVVASPASGELIGRWWILEADLWDRDYLDLVEPAYLQIGNDGWPEFAFGAVNATAELEYGASIVSFRWSCVHEGDEISGADPSRCSAMAQ